MCRSDEEKDVSWSCVCQGNLGARGVVELKGRDRPKIVMEASRTANTNGRQERPERKNYKAEAFQSPSRSL